MASFHYSLLLGYVIFLQCSAILSASLGSSTNETLVDKDSTEVNNVTKECANNINSSTTQNGEYACVELCKELYSCTSLEMGLFELHIKGDRCLSYCGKFLVCNEIQRLNVTDDDSFDVDDKFGITIREFSCGENQRLDKNGVCRNHTG